MYYAKIFIFQEIAQSFILLFFQQEIAHFSKHKHFIIKNIVPYPHDSWDIDDRWTDGASKNSQCNAECLFLVLNKEISYIFF